MTSEQGETDRAGVGDESLADALGAVARQLRDKSAETLAPWDITPAHLRALRTLSRHGTWSGGAPIQATGAPPWSR